MDERQKILMEISLLISKLKETDIYSLEGSNRIDIMTHLGLAQMSIDLMICRLEKQENN